MTRFASLTLVVALAGGCMDVPGGEDESTVRGEVYVCPTEDCWSNSPVIDTFPFHRLFTDGRENEQRFSIARFVKAGIPYPFRVARGRMEFRTAAGWIGGAAAVGGELWLKNSATAREYVIRVTGFQMVDHWAAPDPSMPWAIPQFDGYHLDVTDVINGIPNRKEFQNVCKAAFLPRESPDLRGTPNYLSIVAEADEIDSTSKKVFGQDKAQFNLGCAGHTLFKTYAIGHLFPARYRGFTVSPAWTQTAVKMFAGDYTGTGYSFTVPGVHVTYADELKTLSYYGAPAPNAIEARWNPGGASCLEEARVMANPTPESLVEFPPWNDVEAQLAATGLRPPKCSSTTNTDIYNFAGDHMVTANL